MLDLIIPRFASAAADADLTALVTSTATTVKENMLAVLTTGFPVIVLVGLSFWGAFWVYRKIKRH